MHDHVMSVRMLVRRMSTRHGIAKSALVHHTRMRHCTRNGRATVAGHQMWMSRSMSPHVIWPGRCVEVFVPILMSPAMARFVRAALTSHVREWVTGTSRVVRRIAISALPTESAANTYPPATHNDAICIEALYNRIIVCMGVSANRPNQSGGRRGRNASPHRVRA